MDDIPDNGELVIDTDDSFDDYIDISGRFSVPCDNSTVCRSDDLYVRERR